jgi:uncharacterized phage-associated protein
VANLLLDRAADRGLAVSNLALQKLLYFAHGVMLTRHSRPLVDGYFEAWEYGPVHPLLYSAFKGSGRAPITDRAVSRNLRTGESTVVAAPTDNLVRDVIDDVLRAFGGQPPARLVHLSHSKGGPWDVVVNESGTDARLGLRITDRLISEHFHRHKVAVAVEPRPGDDCLVESPPA